MRTLIALFIVLHGLVHLWYFTLSRRLVEFQPEMGWTGRSWLFTDLLGDSTTRLIASGLFVLLTVALVVGGLAYALRADWWRPALIASAAASAVVLLLFWDGGTGYLVQKGLLGLLIDVAIIVSASLAESSGS